jgi:diguanylate cyclase (GGDEF)-like protein
VRLRHRDGSWLWFDASITNLLDNPGVEGIVANLRDINERKAIAERLEHAAIHDPLTGLPNRALFGDRLGLALNRAQRRHSQVGVIFLDLDHFKLINDSLGHAAGDELLKVVGERLSSALRVSDTVARFGGDEFVVLCDEVTDEATVLDVAGRITETVARPTMLAKREVFITASLGVVISGRPGHAAEELLRDADAAMYRAKDHGRARIELFDERTHTRAVDHLQTDADLHRALERAEFQVHYQPIVDLQTGRVSGFEALIRWLHPTRGLIHPAEFIDHAEEIGLIVPIGAWVLEEACRQTALWHARRNGGPPLSISINLSPRQLAEPSLPHELAQILQRTGVDPNAIWLELTEGALMHDAESTSSALRALRAQGVHLAVDDFGTGYSSLGHLKRFPVEMLKIDQAFVAGLGHDPEDTTIVGAVISLARSLGLAAVAEGLETPLQLAELRTMGCDYAQGYLFGAPKSAQGIGDRPADDLSSLHTTTPS